MRTLPVIGVTIMTTEEADRTRLALHVAHDALQVSRDHILELQDANEAAATLIPVNNSLMEALLNCPCLCGTDGEAFVCARCTGITRVQAVIEEHDTEVTA